MKTKNSLILRVHDIFEPLSDFFAHPANRPSVPSSCEREQLLSGILQILKKRTKWTKKAYYVPFLIKKV